MLKENILLKPYTNYKIGGSARYFWEVKSEEEAREAFLFAKKNALPTFILGSGTNILVSDNGFDGLVIRNLITDINIKGEEVFAGAGVEVKDVLEKLEEKGIRGLEWAGGLPSSIGGAIHGNAGAFGGRISDSLVRARALSPLGDIYDIDRKDCEFSYRSSIFKEQEGWVILGGFFKFERGDAEEIKSKAEELREWRRTKHPIEYGNCGSVFKRVALDSIDDDFIKEHPDITGAVRNNQVATAYFIDQCGLKEKRIGGAKISSKHPNFFINIEGKARAEDIIMLIGVAKHRVMEKFGIILEEEVELVGF